MCTGHFLCFGSGIFDLAVIVKQEGFFLLKKVINFLQAKQKDTKVIKEVATMLHVGHYPTLTASRLCISLTFTPEIRTSSADFTMFLKNPPNISFAFFRLTLS